MTGAATSPALSEQAPTKVKSPYVGLVPYTEADSRFFFGRERDQRRLIENMFHSRLTLLYGASGVGKSSLLRAGLLRHLHQQIRQARARGETPDLAVVYFNEWQGDALPRLKTTVANAVAESNPDAQPVSYADDSTLAGVIEDATEKLDGDLFLILDQFEEYFLYNVEGDGPETFAYQFAQAANRHGSPASFLVSLREDSVSKLDRFKRLVPDLFANYMRVERLTAQQAKEAIEEPIKRYNELDAEERLYAGAISIETELVEEVIKQVRAGSLQLGSGGRGVAGRRENAGIEAPYLQLVMTYLWDREMEAGSPSPRLRLETLTSLENDDVRGADQIVKTHLDRVIEQILGKDHPMCSKVFQFLVTPSGTKIALSATDLAKNADVTVDRLEPVLERLSGSETRILAPVAAPSGSQAPKVYQIYHDSLAQAILDWRGRFEEAARRRATTRRLLLAAAVVLVAVGVAAFSWYLKSEADAARAEAERLQQVADAATSEAKAERESSKAAALEAEAALAEAQNNKELADQLRAQADDATRRSEQFQGEAEQQRQIAEKQTTSLGDRLAEAERRAEEAEKKLTQLTSDFEKGRTALAEAERSAKADAPVLRDLRAIQAGLALGSAGQEVPVEVERRLHQLAGPEGMIPHEVPDDATRITFDPTWESLMRTDLTKLTWTSIGSTYPIKPGVVKQIPTRVKGSGRPTAVSYDPGADTLVVGYSDGRVAMRLAVHHRQEVGEFTEILRHDNKSAVTAVASIFRGLFGVASAAQGELLISDGYPGGGSDEVSDGYFFRITQRSRGPSMAPKRRVTSL